MTEVEKRYSTIEREFLAIVFTLNRLKQYLVGSEFEIQTDHLLIKRLMQCPIDKLSNRLQCWILNIQHCEFKINYVAVCTNVLADTLSRNPIAALPMVDEEQAVECTVSAKSGRPQTPSVEDINDLAKDI